MTTLEGHYFDGSRPLAVPARMDFGQLQARLTAGPVTDNFFVDQIKVSARVANSERFIALPNGGQFACQDNTFLDDLPQDSPSEGLVAWLEQRWMVALGCVGIVLAVLLLGYLFGLPVLAERLAARIPMQTEATLGTQALSWLDTNGWLKPTSLGSAKQEEIYSGFEELYKDLPLEKHYRLYFRSSGYIGPNAFAFPGGAIVITDKMIEAAATTEEVMAVLAHEIAHVELRHTLRSVLQSSAIGLIAATVTADAASLSGAVAGLPALLAQTKYTRAFETEADNYAFRFLKKRGYSPRAFADLMEKLAKEHPGRGHRLAWISTHPASSQRVDNARSAAGK